MLYRNDRTGRPISQLGFGCMRFTKKGGGIDYEKARREVELAVRLGVNYFDTAYIYPGSEACLGRILEETGLREQVAVATKLPQYLLRSAGAIDKIFNEELARLRTDYVDYYLMHMFTDYAEWERLQSLGIEAWIAKQKAAGRIRSVGFSYHGEAGMFLRLLEAYDWDFCQIQYNYLDEHTQAGLTGLRAAAERGVPVIIMEPLRGGKLANLPEEAVRLAAQHAPGKTPAALGLRWLWDQPAVTCVLSGMNSEQMIEENCAVASAAAPGCLSPGERAAVDELRQFIRRREKVGCTGCRYCMPCPKGVDIPGCFTYYNRMYMEKKNPARMEFAQNMALRRQPGFASQCIGCGKCERACPQHLPIRALLKEADKALRPLPFKLALSVARRWALREGKPNQQDG